MKRILSLLLVALGLAAAVPAGRAQQWNQGDPSADEQYALEQINRYRADPVGFLQRYFALLPSDPAIQQYIGYGNRNGSFTKNSDFAAYLADLFKTGLQAVNPAQISKAPMVLYPLFTQQASAKRDMTAAQAAVLSAASSLPATYWATVLTTPAAYVKGQYLPPIPSLATGISVDAPANAPVSGPNATGGTALFASGATRPSGAVWALGNYFDSIVTAREWILTNPSQLEVLISPSCSSDRVTNINGVTRMMGVSVGPRSNTPLATAVSVYQADNDNLLTNDLPYGAQGTVFVTGVAYSDANNNGEYDASEGVTGLTVSLSGSTWYAVTGRAGGYAIPVRQGTGDLTVQFKDSTGKVLSSVSTSVGQDSVKVDYVHPPSKPVQVPVADSTGSTQIINLSTRALTTSGASAMIGGFVISGSGKKTLLIRGMADSLAALGVTGTLKKPLLTLYNGSGTALLTQTTQATYADNLAKGTVTSTSAQVGAFAFAPSLNSGVSSGDTGVVVALSPGQYTVSITPDADTPGLNVTSGGPANAAQGVVLLEIYDVSINDGGRLVDVATRGMIQSGSNQMIVGFAIRGTGARRVLVRGVGPGLAAFGVPGCVDDPGLALFNEAGTTLLQNNDWSNCAQTDQIATLGVAVGAFALPATSKDAGAVALLAPGNYTAGVTPQSANGLGLVEVYETM